MALTETEDIRITAIETEIVELTTALHALATRKELKNLLSIRQKEITDLTNRITDLETQVKLLQA